jgi:hypothetical protein
VNAVILFWIVLTLIPVACSYRPKEDHRSEILRDLEKDAPVLHLRELTSLPDSELPQLETHFSDRAPHHPWLFGHLLARYGTIGVIAKVRSTYAADHLRWGCDSRLPFLGYFLRVVPREGEIILRTALNERNGNGCYRSMLSGVSRVYAAPQLEAVAVDALDDPDPEVAADAALTLSWHGSAGAEGHLWRRLERWTEQWHNRSRELYGNRATGDEPQLSQSRLGDSLRGALITGQAWYFDESRRQRLYTLCWTEQCRGQFVKPSRTPSAIRVRVLQLMYDQPRFEVAWYYPGTLRRFREKISQFPAGSIFGWCTDREGGGELNPQQARLSRKQVKDVVESQGFRFLASAPSGSCSGDLN